MALKITMTAGFLFIFIVLYIIIIFTFYPTKLIYEDDATEAYAHDDHLRLIGGLTTLGDDESLMMVHKEERLMGFLNGSLALVNMNANEWAQISIHNILDVKFDRISKNITWKDVFPEWIDEDIQNTAPKCPTIPMPQVVKNTSVDTVVAQLPCTYVEGRLINKDLFRLQVHLVAAKVALEMGRRDQDGNLTIVFRAECKPMIEIFRCNDMVQRQGLWWVYRVDARRLKEKLTMPVGSCRLAIDLNNKSSTSPPQHWVDGHGNPEAYATVIHSSSRYVCGAIILAQSLVHTRTGRDLLLLHDDSIPSDELKGLVDAGWKLRLVTRIRNPHADKDTYNAYNYTKLRLWLMIEYSKIVFLDADVLVLRNLDFMFLLPQLSARGNDGDLFNSGLMVIEPSKCSFQTMMDRQKEIVSDNGGDQGFLNEIFAWWHRMPCKINFLKTFDSKNMEKWRRTEHLLASNPSEFYAIHYLGMKPWTCYRDYDCNWNDKKQNVFANDAAHRLWWIAYDRMDNKLHHFCNLTDGRKQTLRQNLRNATQENYQDEHWKIPIFDPRFM